MSLKQGLESLLDEQSALSVNRSASVVAQWTLSYAEAARIVSEGKLPTANIELGPDMGPVALTTWQSFWLFCNRYMGRGADVQLLVQAKVNQAAYDVLLIDWNPE